MSGLIRITQTFKFFERTIDSIVNNHFFSSFYSNIKEKDDSCEIEIGVPGMTKKDLQLHFDNGVLYLKGEKIVSSDSWIRKKDFTKFNNTSLEQSFMLPNDVEPESIRAKCKNGLLKISIRKKQNKSRNISVTSTSSNTKKLSDQLKVKDWIKSLKKLFQRNY